ncbi:DUF2255 family protein [Streptomyces sp. NPDC050619]|uniref:DUF2255 family protein n=1 Tax=Streptomyces sp. NPDC050619 TaxID=3157214 RepID=UPI0034476A12
MQRRGNGTLRGPVPIWLVRDGDELYVRSFRGKGGSWWRTAGASHEGHIRSGGVAKNVTFVEVADSETQRFHVVPPVALLIVGALLGLVPTAPSDPTPRRSRVVALPPCAVVLGEPDHFHFHAGDPYKPARDRPAQHGPGDPQRRHRAGHLRPGGRYHRRRGAPHPAARRSAQLMD